MTVILVFMNVTKICHSTHEQARTASDSLKEVSMSFIDEFLKYKLDFEDLKNSVADLE